MRTGSDAGGDLRRPETIITVAVADCRRLVREGVAVLLSEVPGLRVRRIARRLEEIDTAAVHVVVVGVIEAGKIPTYSVVIDAGADISVVVEKIRTRFRDSHANQDGTSRDVETKLQQGAVRRADAGAASSPLTPREETVLAAVSRGESASEIANHLNISVRTVEQHKRRITAKLGVVSQAHAVAAAYSLGILSPDARGGAGEGAEPARGARDSHRG